MPKSHGAQRSAWIILGLTILAAGCSSSEKVRVSHRTLETTDFSDPNETSHAVAHQEPLNAAGTNNLAGGTEPLSVTDPDPGVGDDAGPAAVTTPEPSLISPNEAWLVDGYIGQVNGRPMFADELLLEIRDRLLQTSKLARSAQSAERLQAVKNEFAKIVRDRFDSWVNSSLIVAEAESLLSEEEQQGLFAFMRDFQEREMATRGGTRTAAEQALWEKENISLEDFLRRSRNELLANDIIRKRVGPRVIVSWRDVEREYNRRYNEFNPPSKALIRHIVLDPAKDQEKIDEVKTRLANGDPFQDVATSAGMEEGGKWIEVSLNPDGTFDAGELRESLKEQIAKLTPGETSPAFTLGTTLQWVHFGEVTSAPGRSIYDPEVQTAIIEELKERRFSVEIQNYIQSLKRRWVADDLDQMWTRLLTVAFQRYWR